MILNTMTYLENNMSSVKLFHFIHYVKYFIDYNII